MLPDINKYDPIKFKEIFEKTTLYNKLNQDFDILSFDYHFIDDYYTSPKVTPRQRVGETTMFPINKYTRFSVVPFYYLKFLTDKSPTKIYDLGCGWNIFKKYFDNIIGIDTKFDDYFYADTDDYVDDNYIKFHQGYFESVFSINSLHFYPLSLIRQRVLDFGSMIKNNGTGFLTLNCKRMLNYDKHYSLIGQYNIEELEYQIRSNLSDLPFNFEVFEVDLTCLDNPMDGNIRMVISK